MGTYMYNNNLISQCTAARDKNTIARRPLYRTTNLYIANLLGFENVRCGDLRLM